MSKLAALEKEVAALRLEVRDLRARVVGEDGSLENAGNILYLRRLAEAFARGDKGPFREHNRRAKAARKAGLDKQKVGAK